MKLLLMADGKPGLAITRWLLQEFRHDVALVVATTENDVWAYAQDVGIPGIVFDSEERVVSFVNTLGFELDIGILAWWPKIIHRPLMSSTRMGFINTHPSFLPYNRGKHYNFWALAEQAPFGVSLHMVDDGVDSGNVVAQKPILYSWEDNGETLYAKAQHAMVELFRDTYPAIRKLDFPRHEQDLKLGSSHRAAELDASARIEIDGDYRARDLLNLLRARTFTGHPSCWFEDEGQKFEVRITINKKPI